MPSSLFERVESLLKEIDREDIANMPADAKFFTIKYADVVSLADTAGLWPQQDIRADQPPLGGVNLVRQQ